MTPAGDLLDDMAGLSDPELIARHVAGDPDAFGHLVRRHRDRLWGVAIRTLGDREEAADALQDALLSAFRRADSFRGDAAVTTWLHRIVVNACLDRVRRRRARPTEIFPADADRVAELAVAPVTDPALAGEERLDVMAALRTLSDDQRAAIVLVDMEGYSVAEAATLLGCPTGTIKSRCARGRAQLLPLVAHLRASGNQTSTTTVASPSRPAPPPGPRPSASGGESHA
ncbi:MAG: RNA polymerase sigma factor SigM [Nocardioidaceae bacterium]